MDNGFTAGLQSGDAGVVTIGWSGVTARGGGAGGGCGGRNSTSSNILPSAVTH